MYNRYATTDYYKHKLTIRIYTTAGYHPSINTKHIHSGGLYESMQVLGLYQTRYAEHCYHNNH